MMNSEESKKVKALKRRINELVEENNALRQENDNLQMELQANDDLIKAADNYTIEHQQALIACSLAREKYEIAYKKMMKVKKDYEARMEELIKALEE